MCQIRLGIQIEHLILVELPEFFRFLFKEMMGDDLFGRIFVFQMIQSVLRAEVRNTAVGTDTGAGEKDDVLCLVNDFLKLTDLFI